MTSFLLLFQILVWKLMKEKPNSIFVSFIMTFCLSYNLWEKFYSLKCVIMLSHICVVMFTYSIPGMLYDFAAVQSQNTVSAQVTSKQILTFGFAEQIL